MKLKFIYAMAITVLSLIVSAVITSCDKWPSNYDIAEDEDSVYVAEIVKSVVNPQFTNVSDAVNFQITSKEGASIDSAFLALPETTLRNVANVVLQKKGFINKLEIVYEYKAHPDIYNNLPKEEQVITSADLKKDVDKTATDLGQRPSGVISTSYQYRTDTIDGKPVKIQIKTEASYAE